MILVSNPMFFGMGNHGESCGTIFVSLRLIWRPRNGWRGCRRPRTSSRSEIINLNLTLDFGVKPHVFWHGESWGIMWDHFREPQLDLKGQEQGGGAAGGQEHLHGEKLLLWFRTSYRLDLGVKPHVLGYGKSFGTIFRSLRPIWRLRTGWRGCRRRSPSWSSEILTLVLNIPQTWIVSQAKCSLVCEISSVLHSEPQETHIFTALRSLSKVFFMRN